MGLRVQGPWLLDLTLEEKGLGFCCEVPTPLVDDLEVAARFQQESIHSCFALRDARHKHPKIEPLNVKP